MENVFKRDELVYLFDDSKKVIEEAKNNNLEPVEFDVAKARENDKEKMQDAYILARSFVKILADLLNNIKRTRMSCGIILSDDFDKYGLGKLKWNDIERDNTFDNDYLITASDKPINMNDEVVYDTPSSYVLTDDSLTVLLNFSSEVIWIDKSADSYGGKLKYYEENVNVLNDLLKEQGITVELIKGENKIGNGWRIEYIRAYKITFNRNILRKEENFTK